MFTADLLKDKTVLVTGGGTGLGFAIASLAAAVGARVAICGRREEVLAEAAAKIHHDPACSGAEVRWHSVDVRDYDAVGGMFDRFEQELGGIDLLVNGAAGNFYSLAEDLTPNGFRAVVDTVLHGTFHCAQHFGKRRIAASASQGAMLNIVTTYATTGSAFVLPSACAKAGVLALTTSLAFEWAAYGIRVNALAPGPIPTEGAWQKLVPSAEFEALYRARMPLGRFGTPDELASCAVFLLSDLASYVTGSCLVMDGGEVLHGGEFNFLAQQLPREKLRQLFQGMRPARAGGQGSGQQGDRKGSAGPAPRSSDDGTS